MVDGVSPFAAPQKKICSDESDRLSALKPEPNKNKVHIPSWIPSSVCEATQTHDCSDTGSQLTPDLDQPASCEQEEEDGDDLTVINRDDTTLMPESEYGRSGTLQHQSISPRALTSDEDIPVPSNTSRSESCSFGNRLVHSRPCSRTGSNSSGSPMSSPLHYPGTPRRNRIAARFTHPFIPPSPSVHSDSDV